MALKITFKYDIYITFSCLTGCVDSCDMRNFCLYVLFDSSTTGERLADFPMEVAFFSIEKQFCQLINLSGMNSFSYSLPIQIDKTVSSICHITLKIRQ